MIRLTAIGASMALLAGLAACSATDTQPTPEEVPEIRPGILQGYLPMDDLLHSKAFVPPAPTDDSARQKMDNAIAENMLTLRGSPRWDLAALDADLHFPTAAGTFACKLGIAISEADTPALYILLRRTLADFGLATYSAKNSYQRKRPFMVNDAPICTPEEEELLRGDGSYPSGHTAIGWGWALILSQLDPDNAEAVLARGRAYGESRNVCNVHWRSDIIAGRMVAAGAAMQLQNNAEFSAAMEEARQEIKRARERKLSPDRDCEAEAAALATPLH